jgi:hypothetical protein
MTDTSGQMIVNKWVEDESFRTEMRSDPLQPPNRLALS